MFLLAALLIAQAPAQRPPPTSEKVFITQPQGWIVGDKRKTKRETRTRFIPGNQAIATWRDLISVTTHKRPGSLSAAGHLEKMAARMTKTCRDGQATKPELVSINGYTGAMMVSECHALRKVAGTGSC